MWTWEQKCQCVTQLNALLPSFKVVMIAYCRGERTGKVEQLECVCVWEGVFVRVKIHRIIAGATMCVNVCVCVWRRCLIPLSRAGRKSAASGSAGSASTYQGSRF